ncbi:MAG: 50S ribosomal protein L10 [Marinilabiliaceae bacterium]|jgi:large subunit ribosomal protein L10|nr:50S ribosomal protein L10 [Marinilabiliaceae bacterium]
MRRDQKNAIIDSLAEKLGEYSHFYLTDTAELNAADTSALRRKCFEQDILMVVVKNTLLKRALEKSDKEFDELFDVLKGSTSIMFSNTGNIPAKLIKEFRKKHERPLLKAAYVEESFYIGDNELDALVAIKSKDELIGDLIALLQSPVKNVLSALQSGGNTIHGVLETLSERGN